MTDAELQKIVKDTVSNLAAIKKIEKSVSRMLAIKFDKIMARQDLLETYLRNPESIPAATEMSDSEKSYNRLLNNPFTLPEDLQNHPFKMGR